MTALIDIHTHHLPLHPETAIWNVMPNQEDKLSQVTYASAGLHPWHITADDIEHQKQWLLSTLKSPQIIALGESGLDKLCTTDFELQKEIFRYHIALSEKHSLPLILHVVKAHNEVMQLHSSLQPRQQWIIHGFRGKPQLAQQYLNCGIMLSFGMNYNLQSLMLAHEAGMCFFETDESEKPIQLLYKEIAPQLHIDAIQLEDLTRQNADKVFFSR